MFIKDHPVFFVEKRSNWTITYDQEEALEGGCSFARQGGLIARQNLAIHVSRITCRAICTNLPSGGFYQDHRWSLKTNIWSMKYESVVPHKRRSKLCDLGKPDGEKICSYLDFIQREGGHSGP